MHQLDETPTQPGELFLRVVSTRLEDDRASAPEMYCVLSVGSSSSQNIGIILTLVGLVIADIAPGVPYWWLARKG
jgi:hypothetical protein